MNVLGTGKMHHICGLPEVNYILYTKDGFASTTAYIRLMFNKIISAKSRFLKRDIIKKLDYRLDIYLFQYDALEFALRASRGPTDIAKELEIDMSDKKELIKKLKSSAEFRKKYLNDNVFIKEVKRIIQKPLPDQKKLVLYDFLDNSRYIVYALIDDLKIRNLILSDEIIDKYKQYLNWYEICERYKMTKEFIEKYHNYKLFDMESVIQYQSVVDEQFIIEHEDYFIGKNNYIEYIERYCICSQQEINRLKSKTKKII